MSSETHSCPRRAEAPFQLAGDDGRDRWDNRGGLGRNKPPGLSCSYCGSLHPDTFMQLVEDGWWVGPTDKSYKAYLSQPVDATDRHYGPAEAKFYYQHLSEDQKQRFVEFINAKQMNIGYPGHFYVLPFFVQAQESD